MICIMLINFKMGTWLAKIKVEGGLSELKQSFFNEAHYIYNFFLFSCLVKYDKNTSLYFNLVPLFFCGTIFLINHMTIELMVLKNFLGFLGIAMFLHHVQFDDFLTIGTHSSM